MGQDQSKDNTIPLSCKSMEGKYPGSTKYCEKWRTEFGFDGNPPYSSGEVHTQIYPFLTAYERPDDKMTGVVRPRHETHKVPFVTPLTNH